MFQSFSASTTPKTGGPRLLKLRNLLKSKGLSGFLIPRADAHQGEYVPSRDQRLAWLTGFTGSAGFCAALLEDAGVFVDGRYTLQVRDQIDLAYFTPVTWPSTQLGDWLMEKLPQGGAVAYDPWLHTKGEIEALQKSLEDSDVTVVETENLVDLIWADQPSPPAAPVTIQPLEFAGISHSQKRREIARNLVSEGQNAAVLTQPDAIAWLLNIRGGDIGHTPVALAFAILRDTGHVTLFIEDAKLSQDVRAHLGEGIDIKSPTEFGAALDQETGPVRVDRTSAPIWVSRRLEAAGISVKYASDPTTGPKAQKNDIEIAGTRAAHIRDGCAMAEFLHWIDTLGPDPQISEIEVVQQLEKFRAKNNDLCDISFDTIAGSGPNAALPHYRVDENSNRQVQSGELLLVDSGGQYRDGTTDITRTIAIGTPSAEAARAYTLVLKGMIAVSMARWPVGLAGRDLDPFARLALWQAGLDYDHGTGHGVGCFLGVHEGPQRISRSSHTPLLPGMILSNEPGYYKPGAFGIRIENLLVVEKAPDLIGGDPRPMLRFETITFAPIDTRLVDPDFLTLSERDWLNGYHQLVLEKLSSGCSEETRQWLKKVCAPI